MQRLAALSFSELANYAKAWNPDYVNGPCNAQSTLRLFGNKEKDIRVTLYRDNHAWCPYCQKVWLWLEEKRIPYRIKKVTMFCYGTKESWYKQIVPSGMLPAVEIDGNLITESDDILLALERSFGPLCKGMNDKEVLPLRKLERYLFRAWCRWLCYPTRSKAEEKQNRDNFIKVVNVVEEMLASTEGNFFLDEFSTVDVIFIPYLERMDASLYYYKGYLLKSNPNLSRWFEGLESRDTYRGTQSDFHTHAHDLPPQMGGCYSNGSATALENQNRVDRGPWFDIPDVSKPEAESSRVEALARVLKHKESLKECNPVPEVFDEALRCALSLMMTNQDFVPPSGSDVSLRYLCDRISVPRDMSIFAAKQLRTALEQTAKIAGTALGPPISSSNRYDQSRIPFAS